MDVRNVLGINNALIEFKITSNRPDCRSIIGIAREAAVTLGKELKYPEIKVNGSDEEMSFEIDIQTDLCKRYCGRVVKDVKVDRKSTRLNSSHVSISYAVFCLKKKKKQ